MFNFKDKLNNIIKNSYQTISINSLQEGLNLFSDYIIYKNSEKIKIYDRKCDHAGGKILSKNGLHKCPQHNWIFNPTTGIYDNGVKKKETEYKIDKGNLILSNSSIIPSIAKSKKNSLVKIRFFNHAFLQVESDLFKFATDPWAIGPAFNTGWWLRLKTKKDWVAELNSCDFIYISHNHPDHLHKITLSKVRSDMLFLVPNFSSDSTGVYLEHLGFKNIFRAKFLNEYSFKDTNLILSILKSGDFREDSGLYFSIGSFSCLFDVDSNYINFDRFPKVDLYASAFAGGASGFPLMFENFNLKEKKDIVNKNRNFSRAHKENNLKKIKPKYFLPYAGFFREKLKRDKFVLLNNKKNNIQDYKKVLQIINCQLLDVEQDDQFHFNEGRLVKKIVIKNSFYKDLSPDSYLKYFKKNFKKIDKNYIKDYFINAKFIDNLILIVSLSDDSFKKIKLEFIVDFSSDKIKFEYIKNFNLNKLTKKNNKKYLHMICRKESFLNTIYNKEPWEDLSIGFQCKILRYPNEYNTKFWYHFTNNYITDKNIRFTSECYNCDFTKQLIAKQMKTNG